MPIRRGGERVPVHGPGDLHRAVRRRDQPPVEVRRDGARGVGASTRHRRSAATSRAAALRRHDQAAGRRDERRGGIRRARRRWRRVPPRVLLPGARAARDASAEFGRRDSRLGGSGLRSAGHGTGGGQTVGAGRRSIARVRVQRLRRWGRDGHRGLAPIVHRRVRAVGRGGHGRRGGRRGRQTARRGAVGPGPVPVQSRAREVPVRGGVRRWEAGRTGRR